MKTLESRLDAGHKAEEAIKEYLIQNVRTDVIISGIDRIVTWSPYMDLIHGDLMINDLKVDVKRYYSTNKVFISRKSIESFQGDYYIAIKNLDEPEFSWVMPARSIKSYAKAVVATKQWEIAPSGSEGIYIDVVNFKNKKTLEVFIQKFR